MLLSTMMSMLRLGVEVRAVVLSVEIVLRFVGLTMESILRSQESQAPGQD